VQPNLPNRLRSFLLAALATAACAPLAISQEVPYTSDSLGPFYDIPEPDVDAELRDYAAQFWATPADDYLVYPWEHVLPPLVGIPGGGVYVSERNPFGDGYDVFGILFAHRLLDETGQPTLTIEELVEQDVVIARIWKHWTLYRQIVTTAEDDPVAHMRHRIMAGEGVTGNTAVSLRGVPLFTDTTLATDRLFVEQRDVVAGWFATTLLAIETGSGGTGATETGGDGETSTPDSSDQGGDADETDPEPVDGDDCEDCDCEELIEFINDIKDDLKVGAGNPGDGLYEPDTPASAGPPPTEKKPGFDCDDFATALGNKIQNEFPAGLDKSQLDVRSGRVVFDKPKLDDNGNPVLDDEGKPVIDKRNVGHKVVHVNYKDCYWIIDPQSGRASGPHDADSDTPRDATPVVEGPGYKHPQNIRTAQRPRELDYRSRREPPPFHTDPGQSDRVSNRYNQNVGAGPGENPAGSLFPPGHSNH